MNDEKKGRRAHGGDISVHHVPIGDLKPATYNPRRHDEAAAKQLKRSIKKFGFVDPIIANSAPKRKNVVIGGHFRLKVAEGLGYETVPTVYVSVPDIKRERELNLRLNRNTGEWDLELLRQLDVELLLDVGFDDSDLSDIWDDMLQTEDDGFDEGAELAKLGKPKSKEGDLYRLGRHRLLCGDCTDPATVKRLMGRAKADILLTDPPYNIGLSYERGIGGKGSYGGAKTDDSKSGDEYAAFLGKALDNALAVAAADVHLFVFHDENWTWLVQGLFRDRGVALRRTCLWIKNGFNATPNCAFNKCYEPCAYGTVGRPYLSPAVRNLDEVMNREVGSGNRLPDDIMDQLAIWLADRLPGGEYEHPTQKPPTLYEKPLRRCTRPGAAVLDLFGGSGSLLVACEQMRRRAFLCEQEPAFCDLTIRRYEQLTGEKAKKIG
ncbi:site-specific DNA-methyltransferase [Patescibacteria group bacterium]